MTQFQRGSPLRLTRTFPNAVFFAAMKVVKESVVKQMKAGTERLQWGQREERVLAKSILVLKVARNWVVVIVLKVARKFPSLVWQWQWRLATNISPASQVFKLMPSVSFSVKRRGVYTG